MPFDPPREIADGTEVTLIGGTRIRAEGVAGTLTHWETSFSESEQRFRSFRRPPAEEDASREFRDALAELDMIEQETIHLDVAPNYRHRTGRQGGSPPRDRVVITAAPPRGVQAAQVILYQDESGGVSWHFPDGFQTSAAQPATVFRGPAGRPTFTIATRTAVSQAALAAGEDVGRFRGPITKLGRKIFKVLAIPFLDPLLAAPVQWLGAKIEARYRQEVIRSLTPDNYRIKVSAPFTDWEALQGKRSLLMVHGIFSSTEGVLAQMPRKMIEHLGAIYEGRLLAFDQLSVSCSPEENARTFLETLPRGKHFEFDILCHSRGGIVARTLAEHGKTLMPEADCVFPKVFFVATPNAGSVLADSSHMVEMLDVFTNLITSFPDGPVTYSLEVLLGIVKLLAVTSERHLPGLAAMSTSGYIRDVLNRAGSRASSQYAAAAADYAPDPLAKNQFFTGRIGKKIVDRVFRDADGEVKNDLVVPFEGVFQANGHPNFPIRDPVVFGVSDHVWHSGFFAQSKTLDAIKRHFGSAAPGQSRTQVLLGMSDDHASGSHDTAISRPNLREIRRTPALTFPAVVTAREVYTLSVRLEELTLANAANSLGFPLGSSETQTEVHVRLLAPGFDIVGTDRAGMVLHAVRLPRSETVFFQVTPLDPGPEGREGALFVEFWHGGICVGALRHVTSIVSAADQQPSTATPPSAAPPLAVAGSRTFDLVIRAPRTASNLTVTVAGRLNIDQPPYHLSLHSTVAGHVYGGIPLGEFTPETNGRGLAEYLASIYREWFRDVPLPSASAESLADWQANFRLRLKNLGRKMWGWLPPDFRSLYRKMDSEGCDMRSILISSAERVLPWELLVPETEDGLELPLGRRHFLGRWHPVLPLLPDPQRLQVKRFCLLSPEYRNAQGEPTYRATAREVEGLLQRFSRLERISPATFAHVRREVLERKDMQVVHFSGHGEFSAGQADLSALQLLGNDTLTPIDMGGKWTSAPLVYLNACEAGATAKVAAGLGGFAVNLIDNGCSGVIAPYWRVEDDQACDFALALYDKLAGHMAVGEALCELRRDHPDDLTYQSFTYFGDPWAKLDLSAVL